MHQEQGRPVPQHASTVDTRSPYLLTRSFIHFRPSILACMIDGVDGVDGMLERVCREQCGC